MTRAGGRQPSSRPAPLSRAPSPSACRAGAAGSSASTRLAIEDLLEHLAHPGTHQGAASRLGVVVTSPVPGGLTGVELVVHDRIVGLGAAARQRRRGARRARARPRGLGGGLRRQRAARHRRPSPRQSRPPHRPPPTADVVPSTPSRQPRPRRRRPRRRSAAVDVAAAFRTMVADPAFSARVAISAGSSIGGAETSTTGHASTSAAPIDGSGSPRVPAGLRRTTTRSSRRVAGTCCRTACGSNRAPRRTSSTRCAPRPAHRARDDGRQRRDAPRLSISPVTDLPIPCRRARRPGPGHGVRRPRADGTTVTVRVTPPGDSGSASAVDAARSAEFGFQAVGSAVTVAVPDDLWTFHSLEALRVPDGPPGRLAGPRPRQRQARRRRTSGSAGRPCYASRATSRGLSLATLSSALTRYLPGISGVRKFVIDRNRPARLGPLRARRIEFHYSYKGQRYWAIGYLAVQGRRPVSPWDDEADEPRRPRPGRQVRLAVQPALTGVRGHRRRRGDIDRHAAVSGSASRRRRSARRR